MRVFDRELLHRIARFVLTVGLPVGVAVVAGVRPWLVYAALGAILAFVGDEGGRPLRRLGYMVMVPAGLVLGAAVGTAAAPQPVLFVGLTFLVGLFYGLVAGGHLHLLQLARFIGYGLVMGYAVAPLDRADALAAAAAVAAAWLISLLWDLARGGLRPLAVEPVSGAVKISVTGWRSRSAFALCAGLAIAAANLTGAWLGLGHPYWATLTILVVLRSEVASSADSIIDRVLGTLLGVGIVALLVTAAPGQATLLAGMVVAAALRWPAFRLHLALGTATITVFVLLLGELLVATPQAATGLLHDRLLATMVGCCFAMAALGLHRNIELRWPAATSRST